MHLTSRARLALASTVGAALAVTAPLTAVAAPTESPEPAPSAAALDLAPSYTSSALKAPGFTGYAHLTVANVGSDGYDPATAAVRFTVDVTAVDGPSCVDRIIDASGEDGAIVLDRGFNRTTCARTFEVILSNRISAGDSVNVASFRFADGLTKEGRLKQKLVTSQTGRLAGDTSTDNDQKVDSTADGATTTPFGRNLSGLF